MTTTNYRLIDAAADSVHTFEKKISGCYINLQPLSPEDKALLVTRLQLKVGRVLAGKNRIVFDSGVCIHLTDYVIWDGVDVNSYHNLTLFRTVQDARDHLNEMDNLDRVLGYEKKK